MFADLLLTNGVRDYACYRFRPDGISNGVQQITCQRQVGTMSTDVPCEFATVTSSNTNDQGV